MTQEALLKCPFCGKENLKAIHKPSYMQAKTSRISAGAKITYQRVPETYQVVGSCPDCGKTAREIQDRFEGKKEIPHEERIARMKNAGIPTAYEDNTKYSDED